MKNRSPLLLTLTALCLVAWAQDANMPADAGNPARQVQPAFATSEGASPSGAVSSYGDVPPGWQPAVSTPTEGPEPTCGMFDSQGELPGSPTSFWENDYNVHLGSLRSPPDGFGTERMLSQDYSSRGDIYAAVVPATGESLFVYRSTNGGVDWSRYTWVAHAGQVLSSPEVIVAEGASDHVFVFFKTSAGAGNIYVIRWNLGGGGSTILPVKVDSDTIANFSAAADLQSEYHLFVTYEQRGGGFEYNAYTLKSIDYGATWSGTPSSSIVDTRVSPKPDICYGTGNRMYVVFADKRQSSRPDTTSLRIKVSTNRGITWLGSEQVGTPIVPVSEPLIGARHTGSTLWLVHQRDMNPFNGTGDGIFSYYSNDSGSTWTYGGDLGVGRGNTPNNERMPSIACNKGSGAVTLTYSVVPSESLMFTWASSDTNWTAPLKINDHRHTGNFASAAGWKSAGGLLSSLLYAGSGPVDVWYDAWAFVGAREVEPAAAPAPTLAARPNPVARRALISYSLSRPGLVDLSVYDNSGRQLARLEHGNLPAGSYQATWDCRGAAAGVYLCRLLSPDGIVTNRLVVSR